MELTIDRINSAGQGIGRAEDGRTAFVEGALPGERVIAVIRQEKKSYFQCRVERVLEPHPQRRTPPCPWNRSCGGCQLQHAEYPLQVRLKGEIAADALTRLGGFTLNGPIPCEPAEREWGWRNKASFPVRVSHGKPSVGFFRMGSHDLIPVDRCPVICSRANELYALLKSMIEDGQFFCLDERTGKGWLRHLVLRSVGGGTDLLLVLVVTSEPSDDGMNSMRDLWEYLEDSFPELRGLVLNVNTDPGNVIFGTRSILVGGTDEITEKVGSFLLSYDSTSFFQADVSQAEKLFRYASDLAIGQNIVELYCGVGALTAFLARQGRSIEAVELWPSAVQLARKNIAANRLTGITVTQGAAEDFLTAEKLATTDCLVVDPPRGGCDPQLLQTCIDSKLKRFLYISCNPATLARDAAMLRNGGFEPQLKTLRCFDLFPQTSHVETVVLMSRVEEK